MVEMPAAKSERVGSSASKADIDGMYSFRVRVAAQRKAPASTEPFRPWPCASRKRSPLRQRPPIVARHARVAYSWRAWYALLVMARLDIARFLAEYKAAPVSMTFGLLIAGSALVYCVSFLAGVVVSLYQGPWPTLGVLALAVGFQVALIAFAAFVFRLAQRRARGRSRQGL
jgi:hypothetical protein